MEVQHAQEQEKAQLVHDHADWLKNYEQLLSRP